MVPWRVGDAVALLAPRRHCLALAVAPGAFWAGGQYWVLDTRFLVRVTMGSEQVQLTQCGI